MWARQWISKVQLPPARQSSQRPGIDLGRTARTEAKKPNEPPEPEHSTHQPQKKPAKKKEQHSNKLVDAQVQQALTTTLAPFLEQFKTMSEHFAARAVRPCFTGYIR